MKNNDHSNDDICVSFLNEAIKKKEIYKVIKSLQIQYRMLDKIEEIEHSVDSSDDLNDIKNNMSGIKKRRLSKCVKLKSSVENAMMYFQNDYDEIFANIKKNDIKQKKNFDKNDDVICIINKKKYHGTVFQVHKKGLVIKTNEKRKIKIHWDNIDGNDIQVIKV